MPGFKEGGIKKRKIDMKAKFFYILGAAVVVIALFSNLLIIYWFIEDRRTITSQMESLYQQNLELSKNNILLEQSVKASIDLAQKFSDDYQKLISSAPGSKEAIEAVLGSDKEVHTGGD